MTTVKIKDETLRQAAAEGMDSFLDAVLTATKAAAGGELNAESMAQLSAEHIALWAYGILRDEVMDGGFVQLIHNGYGPFIFLNPFARVMRLWGLKDLSKLIYRGRELFEQYGEEITKPSTDEEFMALFEQYPEFDDLDDEFVEHEEEYTAAVAYYVDEHLEDFVTIV